MEKNTYNVVAAIVMDRGEVLCVQKPHTKYAYTSFHWEYPGGKVEEGEDEYQALKRELLEEMNYPVEVMGKLTDVAYEYPDFCVLLHFYLCKPSNQSAPRKLILKEHIDLKWVAPQCVPFIGDWCAADYKITAQPKIINLFQGTAFQKEVWKALCRIPHGETRTYTQVAEMAGYPKAIRAVGNALHNNPLPYYIPCHRVVGKNGIGGYAYGIKLKQKLLALEIAKKA